MCVWAGVRVGCGKQMTACLQEPADIPAMRQPWSSWGLVLLFYVQSWKGDKSRHACLLAGTCRNGQIFWDCRLNVVMQNRMKANATKMLELIHFKSDILGCLNEKSSQSSTLDPPWFLSLYLSPVIHPSIHPLSCLSSLAWCLFLLKLVRTCSFFFCDQSTPTGTPGTCAKLGKVQSQEFG